MGREGEDARVLGLFYVAVLQEILMYGLETWIISPHIGRTLEGLLHRVVFRLTDWYPSSRMNRKWVYHELVQAMDL